MYTIGYSLIMSDFRQVHFFGKLWVKATLQIHVYKVHPIRESFEWRRSNCDQEQRQDKPETHQHNPDAVGKDHITPDKGSENTHIG